ncbi:hypothetical protein HID58_069518 [Brassica napus]|uniref:Uncharacterized protein n=1 Tax=Brassica napus TaxID=3708 RepID=A0ABQ7YW81_BRANA|nr:hypothetical protein HID58_069518 [Brassica napus]
MECTASLPLVLQHHANIGYIGSLGRTLISDPIRHNPKYGRKEDHNDDPTKLESGLASLRSDLPDLQETQRLIVIPHTKEEATTERGVPLQSDMASIQPEALQRAVGEVRDVMIQYTKSSDPTESAARKERMRQAEEQGEVEETALKIVRANLDAEAEKRRLEEHTTPERIPASQRLSSPSSHRSSRQKSDGQSQNSKSHDRLPASSRLGPVILEQSHNSAERNTTMTERTPPERVPVALRLGTSAELPIPEKSGSEQTFSPKEASDREEDGSKG